MGMAGLAARATAPTVITVIGSVRRPAVLRLCTSATTEKYPAASPTSAFSGLLGADSAKAWTMPSGRSLP